MMSRLLKHGLVAFSLLAVTALAFAVTNAEWQNMNLPGPPPTVTVKEALDMIHDDSACTPEVSTLCDYWLSWSGEDPAPAMDHVVNGWDAYNSPPINWTAVKDALDM